MIEISMTERKMLESKGCEFHKDIFKTYTRHPKFYLVESQRNLKLLNKCRNERVNKTVEG